MAGGASISCDCCHPWPCKPYFQNKTKNTNHLTRLPRPCRSGRYRPAPRPRSTRTAPSRLRSPSRRGTRRTGPRPLGRSPLPRATPRPTTWVRSRSSSCLRDGIGTGEGKGRVFCVVGLRVMGWEDEVTPRGDRERDTRNSSGCLVGTVESRPSK